MYVCIVVCMYRVMSHWYIYRYEGEGRGDEEEIAEKRPGLQGRRMQGERKQEERHKHTRER